MLSQEGILYLQLTSFLLFKLRDQLTTVLFDVQNECVCVCVCVCVFVCARVFVCLCTTGFVRWSYGFVFSKAVSRPYDCVVRCAERVCVFVCARVFCVSVYNRVRTLVLRFCFYKGRFKTIRLCCSMCRTSVCVCVCTCVLCVCVQQGSYAGLTVLFFQKPFQDHTSWVWRFVEKCLNFVRSISNHVDHRDHSKRNDF